MFRYILVFFLILFCTSASANFKQIKKKAEINNPEIIFPIPANLKNCQTELYVSPENNFVTPVLKVEAPEGYGLDDRFNHAQNKFENFSFPCSGGNIEGSKIGEKVNINDCVIYAPRNLPSLIAYDASLLFSKNIYNFISNFITENKIFDIEAKDELLLKTTLVKNGNKTENFYDG